ncbi:hypothetical protein GCM10009765_21420 [Fodinicola feengrottensis]|uniref:Uncharacterized protein n=1 Tax=Fodinicola feengrottensis TaxID=435914 RepID=A0ABN2GI98_9ACTN
MISARNFAVAAAGLALALSPAFAPAASAAPADAIRTSCHNADVICNTSDVSFGGGRISIDVDVNGTGTAHWWLYNDSQGGVACQTDFSALAPAASWTCDVGAGTYRLGVRGTGNTTDTRGDLRW